jgi:single-stranded-DNA-specific exonuclease
MSGRAQACARIAQAIRSKETICVFGDYDADGITSTALLVDALTELGARIIPLLAERFQGGYGVSDAALQRICDTRPSLVVTCDCGSSDHPRLVQLRERGIDAVVIDHHRVPDVELPVHAFLNPHQPGCRFAYKGLASVGLAFSVVAGVRTVLGVDLDMRRWLDLVALGTIADVAPLDGDNRALVRAGLAHLTRNARPGIVALAESAGIARDELVTGEDGAFRLAPRVNAPGRLGSPMLALRLLLSKDIVEARDIAERVEAICEERKTLDRTVLAEALEQIESPAMRDLPVVVVGAQGWHQGVVGIVAGRLASRTGKPTVVVGFDGDMGRGSVRGPQGASLYDALTRCAEHLMGFGGHQAAAGVHLRADALDAFRDAFARACPPSVTKAPSAVPSVDASVVPGDRLETVQRELEQFEPCGQTNPTPMLSFEGVTIRDARTVRGGHLALELSHGGQSFRGFGFAMGDTQLRIGGKARIIGKLRRDTYRGAGQVEVRLEHFTPE